jgi:hypothetical protein
MTWRNSTNQAVGIAAIADITTYLTACNRPAAPIDTFYSELHQLLALSTTTLLDEYEALGPLLLVGLVSRTENFFRDVFGQVIRLCPIAQAKAADQSIKLGSVIWHGGVSAERSAFEHLSLADSDTIKSSAKKMLAYDLKSSAPLREFDKVCELRHGIVHANCLVAGINAVKLQLPPSGRPVKVHVDYARIQECALVCTSLVTSVNEELFAELCRRWADDWRRLPNWDSATANRRFNAIWHVFVSLIDRGHRRTPDPMGIVSCRNQVIRDLT